MLMRKKTLLALALLAAAPPSHGQTTTSAGRVGTAKVVRHGGDSGYTKAYLLGDGPTLDYGIDGTAFNLFCWNSTTNHQFDTSTYYTFTADDKAFEMWDTDENLSTNLTANTAYEAAVLGRTLVAGDWNTFCVPFAMSADQVKAVFGEEAKLREFDKAEGKVFRFKEAKSIEAGKAYLVKPSKANPAPAYNTTVTNVTVSALSPKTVSNGQCGLQGTYTVATLNTDGTHLFVSSGHKVMVPSSDGSKNKLRGMRAYLVMPQGQASQAKEYTLDFADGDEDGATTAVSSLPCPAAGRPSGVYTLGGQYVGASAEGLPKGVYIIGGRKAVVK